MLALLTLLAAAAYEPPAAAPPPAPLATEEQLATDHDRAERMTVSASIDGQGPYAFTIDTAADRSVVSDRLASTLALPAGNPLRMHAITGSDMVASVRLARLSVGRSEQRNINVPVLSERALGSMGLLGLDALANKRVVMDFKAQRMTLSSTAPSDWHEIVDPNEIVVTARSRFGQLILTNVTLHGHKVYAIIDTGAQNTIGNAAFRQLLADKGPMPSLMATLVGVTGRTVPAERMSVPRIAIGGVTMTDMPVAIADVHTFALFKVDRVPALLLGMDVLRAFDRVAIDFRRREIRFRLDTGRADTATQLASAISRPGVSNCGSACASRPGG